MIQYKLIKEYPGSPKLGTIDWYKIDELGPSSNSIWQGTNFYDAHPKYWQKVEEVDYEVLSYRDYNGKIFEYSQNGYAINSVKRLSDGEVFTIGDLIDFATFGNKGFQKIDKFEIDCFNKTRITAYNSAYGIGIARWKKAPAKTPLFTTEDGVEIFKGDTVWHTNLNTSKKPYSSIVEYKEPFKPVRGLFSTKEKAEEYILLNKLCLSIKEITDLVLNNPNMRISDCAEIAIINSLKQLAKSKL